MNEQRLVSTAASLSEQLSDANQALTRELAAVRQQLAASERTIEELGDALDRASAREWQLAYEVQHRVRNMLAVIRSIYRRSFENGASQDEFAEHFEGRLDAIARCQFAMTGLNVDGMDLEDIVREELLAINCSDETNVTISGPAVRLTQKVAELMGLAIHELSTNAIKFGALQYSGTLNIEWSLSNDPAQENLDIRWIERGVPMLTVAPRANGYGRQLIEDALPYQLGATTSFQLRPGGVDCSISLPIAHQLITRFPVGPASDREA